MTKTILALSLLAIAGVANAGILYQQTSTTGLQINTATAPTALDDVNFATGSTTVRQKLSSITLGAGVAANTAAQTAVVFVDFYNTVNSASTGVVTSNYLGGFGGTLNIAATGTSAAARAFSFSGLDTALTTPIFFDDDNVGVVITFANAAGTAYSTILSPLLSTPGVPSVGSSVTGVYRDVNNDGDFQASEFDATQGNLYLSVTTVAAPVPEPASMIALGLGAAAMLRRRKKA